MTPDVRRRLSVIQREWQRIDPRYLDEDEQRYWASIAGRQVRFEERAEFVKKLSDGKASKACLEQFLATAAAENPNRRLRMMALADRVSMTVERADFDDLVTLVIQAATWDKDRIQGARILLRAIGEGKADAPEQILARWTWKLARATRKAQDRRVSAEFPEAKRLLGALANSRGHRHEENAAKLVNAALGPAARGGRRVARLGRRLHAAGDQADRGGAREDRHAPGGRLRAGREPAAAEGTRGSAQAPPQEAQGRRQPQGQDGQKAQTTENGRLVRSAGAAVASPHRQPRAPSRSRSRPRKPRNSCLTVSALP